MMLLTAMTGFTRLLGLGHVLWFPLLFFLWGGLGEILSTDWFGLWLRGLMLVNAISLVFDVIEVLTMRHS